MRKIFAIIFFLLFLIIGIITLPGYGINWDTINHLPRGQAYLHFFLTGRQDYRDLIPWQKYFQNPKSLSIDTDIQKKQVPGRSIYQSDATTYAWFINHDGNGHPPLSDILSSVFNRVLFGKLRLINDIDSYRVYGIFLAAALVALVFWWVSDRYGSFAGFIASLSLSVYPLFFSESHFNTEKDIPEAVFWSFMLFCFWKGMVTKTKKWLILSGVFFGLALGTKFNILFSVLVIAPWLVVYFGKAELKKNLKLLFFAAISFLIGFGIFFASWPYLWGDPINRINKVSGFYENIGLTVTRDPRFMIFKLNTYPIQWIIYTTPLIILALATLGVVVSILRLRKDQDKLSLLFLLWLLVPIARVTMPSATIYGGVRQIMEYIPALSIFSGIGGGFLAKHFKQQKILVIALIILVFSMYLNRLYSIHPNENVYFNELIGGLSGAKGKELPAWGNSFGAAYRQGVEWIDDNAPKGAKVALARELMPNIPPIWFREDLQVSNRNRSGYLREGEYVIGLTYQGTDNSSYFDSYLEKFLQPVYQTKVDNVAILKVWQNDEAHLKIHQNEAPIKNVLVSQNDKGLTFDLRSSKEVSRLEINYDDQNCQPLKSGIVQLSMDGKNFQQQWGALPDVWRVAVSGEQPQNGKFIEPFLGQRVRFIRLLLTPKDTCLKKIKDYSVYYFTD